MIAGPLDSASQKCLELPLHFIALQLQPGLGYAIDDSVCIKFTSFGGNGYSTFNCSMCFVARFTCFVAWNSFPTLNRLLTGYSFRVRVLDPGIRN